MQYFGFDRPSFQSDYFGFFESGPKLVADFTTGTYKASGVDKTFAEVFTFSRAGKAWLVKDTGLVEYAVDAPRFDDGLLIEQSATNYAAWSLLPQNGEYVKRGLVFTNGHWVYDGVTAASAYIYTVPYPDLSYGNRIFSTVGVNGRFYNMRTGTSGSTALLAMGNLDYYVKIDADDTDISGLLYSRIDSQYALYYQVEGMNQQQLPTSPIVTTTSPVTRPADYIQTLITGTTVTGDWDSTLKLSIENGQLVHTGYGRIRSLEIN